MIAYRVDLPDPRTHAFRVTLRIARPAAAQRLSLPVWIPGSYLVREFGRHLSKLAATQGRRAVQLEQLDKTTWIAHCSGSADLVLQYDVHAFDNSVRAAWLDTERGFFNGTSLCLRVEGREQEPHRLSIGKLPRGWDVATAMRAVGPKQWEAADYDELVDHPFELGPFWRGRFEAAGVPHEFIVSGAWPSFDGDRLLADTRRICETQIAFWHGGGRGAKPPYERYVFFLNAVEDGYGGLEHRASTALIAARRDLPRRAQKDAMPDGYATLLGLVSHEFFHTWNVKRLKPRELAPLDYTRENYTPLLWFFEGFTSYYDDLFLVRSGLIDMPRYCKLVAKTLNGVLATPGRRVQSVAQASYDAWNKYYRQDENTPNATISYYAKGSLVGLALDLTLRAAGKGSLDDVMRALWALSSGGPIGEDDIARALREVGGRSYARELAAWVHGTDDLPLLSLLEKAGIGARSETPALAGALGLRVVEGPGTGVQVRSVLRGSAAERAGLQAGDEILAADGWRLRKLDDAAQWLGSGRPFELLVSRDQRIRTVEVVPQAPTAGLVLAPVDKPAKAAAALRRAWLGG